MSESIAETLHNVQLDSSTEGIKVTQFSRRIADQMILYEVLRYPDRCLFVWIGTNTGDLSNLAMTMPSLGSKESLATTLFGTDLDEYSLSLSRKIARRFGGKKQVYVSLNLPNFGDSEMLFGQIEQALFDHIRENQQNY